MIDFSKVAEISIPGGIVVKISCGDKVLWERPRLLPSGYQQVEYIATDGNQYIDTGVLASNHNDGIRYVFRGNVTKYQSTSLIYWFGALVNGCRSGNFFTNSTGDIGIYAGGTGNEWYKGVRPAIGTAFELTVQGTSQNANNFIVSLDGALFNKNGTLVDTDMPHANIHLFTAIGTSAASTANRKYYGKLYSFTMDSVDGTPIRNFVPCYRKSDSIIGLFDTVGGQFYTNIGTGSFSKGADVA